jgi:DNA-binding CsgD family transcriptional regulator
VLSNGLGLYDDALAAARRASETTPELFVADWALVELVEAASRTGDARLAAEAAARLVDKTRATGSDWALGLAARSQALASDAAAAEPLYAEAVARLGRTRVRPELARTHLLFGEWLRREGRRVDAREQLRKAHDMLAAMGMEAFAERARRELVATGEKARKRTADTLADLTPQEAQIAQLAREGLSNPEIGTQLFLSPRTVEWHLRKVFGKLDISSRKELDGALRTRREVPVA